MNNFLRTLALACIMAASSLAQAATYVYSGDTTGQPTWNRPLVSLTDTSAIGTAVAYDAFSFTVTASGLYDFSSETVTHDGFIFLYSPFFPAMPLSYALAANDDDASLRRSAFAYTLTAGTAYTFVNTGFANDDVGVFTTTISGPGAILAAVPEPETYAMLLAGLALMGFIVRRRKQA